MKVQTGFMLKNECENAKIFKNPLFGENCVFKRIKSKSRFVFLIGFYSIQLTGLKKSHQTE